MNFDELHKTTYGVLERSVTAEVLDHPDCALRWVNGKVFWCRWDALNFERQGALENRRTSVFNARIKKDTHKLHLQLPVHHRQK